MNFGKVLDSSISSIANGGAALMSNHARRVTKRKAPVTKVMGASGAVLTLGAALVAVSPGTAGAANIVVDSAADDGSGGLTLREAIVQANGTAAVDDVITFAASLNGSTITLASEIDITDDLVVQGPGSGLLTVSGGDSNRIFYIGAGAGAVTVSGLTLTEGDTGSYGGAIASYTTGPLTITNAVISNSYAEEDGGGVAVLNASSLTVTGTTFSGNYSDEDGGGLSIYNVSGAVSISSSTFDDNQAADYGGGIALYQVTGTVTINDATVTNNSASYGGGVSIYESTGAVTISNSTISGNSADTNGGGVRSYGSGDLTIAGSTISGNAAKEDGGGIHVYNSDALTITGSTISGSNTADLNGGAIALDYVGSVAITQTTIAGNQSDDGGAIDADGVDDLTIDRSTISGNTATDEGGAIHTDYTNLTVLSTTISGNDATNFGGGIHFEYGEGGTDLLIAHSTVTGNTADGGAGGGVYLDGADATIDHTIIAGNTGGDIGGTGTSDISNSLIGDSDTDEVTVTDGGNNAFDVAAGLAPLASNGGPTQTHALVDGSAALDSGDPSFAPPPATDQRGEARVANGVIDKGAYERQEDEPATGPAGATPVAANPSFTG